MSARDRRLSLTKKASEQGASAVPDLASLSLDGSPPVGVQNGVANSEVIGNLLYVGLSQAGHEPDGVKKENQDSMIMVPSLEASGKAGAFFGVFDGHGSSGHHVSRYVIRHFPSCLPVAKLVKDQGNKFPVKAMEEGCAALAKMIEKQKEIDCSLSGTTSITALVRNRHIFVANLGDSRCVMARQPGGPGTKCQTINLSDDQKPERADEKKRIVKAGGRVEPLIDETGEAIGPSRVWLKHMMLPGLAMTRSFGDQVAASVGVFAEPEVLVHEIAPADKFMILASDGVWEFLSSEDAVALVESIPDPAEAVTALVAEASKKWREEEDVMDDITAVIVYFQQ